MPHSSEKPTSVPNMPSNIDKISDFIPNFDQNGLICVVVTNYSSGEVLMLAWMNDEALHKSITTGIAHFWSRSREKLWKKGEESGNFLEIQEMRIDCDQDALWIKVNIRGAGAACHTGARSCFYRKISLSKDLKRGALPPLIFQD